MSVYKQPVVVPNADISYQTDPNTMSAMESTPGMPARRVSGGNPARNAVKTDGVVQRGAGAAVRGKTSRGPLA